jgi:hypothetical protein
MPTTVAAAADADADGPAAVRHSHPPQSLPNPDDQDI